jgi:hypothetical protein
MKYRCKNISHGAVIFSSSGASALVMKMLDENSALAIEEGTGYGVLKRIASDADVWEFEPSFPAHVPLQSYY